MLGRAAALSPDKQQPLAGSSDEFVNLVEQRAISLSDASSAREDSSRWPHYELTSGAAADWAPSSAESNNHHHHHHLQSSIGPILTNSNNRSEAAQTPTTTTTTNDQPVLLSASQRRYAVHRRQHRGNIAVADGGSVNSAHHRQQYLASAVGHPPLVRGYQKGRSRRQAVSGSQEAGNGGQPADPTDDGANPDEQVEQPICRAKSIYISPRAAVSTMLPIVLSPSLPLYLLSHLAAVVYVRLSLSLSRAKR